MIYYQDFINLNLNIKIYIFIIFCIFKTFNLNPLFPLLFTFLLCFKFSIMYFHYLFFHSRQFSVGAKRKVASNQKNGDLFGGIKFPPSFKGELVAMTWKYLFRRKRLTCFATALKRTTETVLLAPTGIEHCQELYQNPLPYSKLAIWRYKRKYCKCK